MAIPSNRADRRSQIAQAREPSRNAGTSVTTQGKIGLLGSLYLSQGLPFGFFTQALPILLRKAGYSLEAIGLASLLALPWAFKFMWAPWVDRIGSTKVGRRRSWILPLQATTAVVLGTLAFLPLGSELNLLLAGVLLVNLLSATQDIATDGLAVDTLTHSERGIGNGVQVAGYRLGMIVGGGALLVAYDSIGWSGTFLAMAAIVALASLPLLLHKEASAVVVAQQRPKLLGFFKRQGATRLVVLIAVYKFGEHFATGMLRPFLADAGFTLSEVGWLLGTVGFVSGLLGALLGGALVNALGRKTALVCFGLLQAGSVAGYAVLAATEVSPAAVYALCAFEHLAGGMATAALFTCMMDWCRPEASASDYTLQASIVVLASGSAAAASGFSAASLGYPSHFIAATILAAGAVWAAFTLFPSAGCDRSSPPVAEEAKQCA